MVLVDIAGRDLGRHITLGSGGGTPVPDGAGGILISTGNGDIVSLSDDPDGVPSSLGGRHPAVSMPHSTIVGTGRLIAAGPTGHVSMLCPAERVCELRYVDRNGQLIRTIRVPTQFGQVLSGQLSPDGTELAVTLRPTASDPGSTPEGNQDADAQTPPTLAIVELAHDNAWQAPWITPNPDGSAQALAWTPDSRWLLVTTGEHQLIAINGHTHDTYFGQVQVPYLTQLVIQAGR